VKFQSVLGSSFVAAVLAFSPGASAALLTLSENTYSFSWSYFTGSYDLTGNGSMTVTGFGTNSLSIEITLNNTSPNTGVGGDRLTAFAFGIDPNATSVTFSDTGDGGMTNAGFVTTGAMPSNVQGVEICAWGGQNCSGGSNGGIFAGQSDTFTLLLGGTWGTQVNIDPIGLRYQTGNGSFTFPAGNGTSVPEPGSLALLGLGIFGAGLARRRAKRA
jgi:hypothetical protein